MDTRIVDKYNRKTPNFAYGNFSFQEKGFNSDYRGVLTNSQNLSDDKLSIIADIIGNRHKNERNKRRLDTRTKVHIFQMDKIV